MQAAGGLFVWTSSVIPKMVQQSGLVLSALAVAYVCVACYMHSASMEEEKKGNTHTDGQKSQPP